MNKRFDISDVSLETNRLILRMFKQADLNDFYEYSKVDGVGQMAGWFPNQTIEIAERVLKMFIDEKNVFCLYHKETKKVIGSIGIKNYPENLFSDLALKTGCEIGYVLSKDYWGCGLMTEACSEVLKYLFETELLDFVLCGAFVYNKRSKRVQEKLNFQFLKRIKYQTSMNTIEDCDETILFKEDYFLNKALEDKIAFSENSYNLYNCQCKIYDNFKRYTDDEIYDMWDHNYFELNDDVYTINQDLLNQMLTIKNNRKEKHLKVVSNHPLTIAKDIDSNFFEEGVVLTMVLNDIDSLEEARTDLVYQDVQNDHIEQDIYELDMKYYGPIFGFDYYQRRYHYLFDRIKKDAKLNYLGVYLNNKIVGMCYYYLDPTNQDKMIIGLDDLLVEEAYRHQGIMRTIIYHLTHKYHLPIYLHADSDDTPKDLYLKMGFKIINKTYEYVHHFQD